MKGEVSSRRLVAEWRRVYCLLRHRDESGNAHFGTPYAFDILSRAIKVCDSKVSQCLNQLHGDAADRIAVLHLKFSVLVVLLTEATQREGGGAQIVKLIEQRFDDFESPAGAQPRERCRDLHKCVHIFLT